MNILQIKIQNNTIFKSYTDDGIIACDDPAFQEIRNSIRKHYDKWHYDIPYNSIYEKGGKLNTQQLQSMISNLEKYHDIKKISNDLNIYRGQTLVEKPYCLYKIKNKGIKTVVDLVGYGKGYEEEVKQTGLKYYLYDIYENWWSKIDFCNDDIKKLVNFIKVMQEGNIYIACQHGANDTDIALLLNDFFNPMLSGKVETKFPLNNSDFSIKLNFIYDAINKNQKKQLGWTKEFEKKLIKKLANI